MTSIQLQDNGATGINLNYLQTNAAGQFLPFFPIATGLSYADLHTVEMAIYFKNGFYNDVVNFFLSGTLIHTGGTWESYFQFIEAIAPGQPPRLQAVNSLLIRASGSAVPATSGRGFNFHTIHVSTTIPPTLPIAQPTQPGEDVVVTFDESNGGKGNITFGEVTSPGVTTVTPVAPVPSDPLYVPPSNVMLGESPTYFDISTTANVAGPIQVCLAYPPGSIPFGTLPSLYHFAGGQWVDITSARDAASGTVCGLSSSLSPFAVGFLIITEDALNVKALRLVNKKRSGSWSVIGTSSVGDAAANLALLDSIDAMGVVFEVYDNAAGLVDAVAFDGKDCKRIGFGNGKKKTRLVCRIKTVHTNVRATFKRTLSVTNSSKASLRVDAKFLRRPLKVASTSLKGLGPLEVRMVTMASFGALASGDLACKGATSKLICKTV